MADVEKKRKGGKVEKKKKDGGCKREKEGGVGLNICGCWR